MPKIFIANRGYHDFSDAFSYGDPVYLTEGKISILATGNMLRTFEPALETSTKEDYILLTGPGIMNSILCSLFTRKHDCLNLLLYQTDREGIGHYKVRRINFNNKE